MTRIPPGYALVSVADLAALHAARAASHPRHDPPSAPAPQPAGATMAGLAEAISLLAARHHGIDGPGLSGDVPAGNVTAALVIVAAALLATFIPSDRAAAILRDLGAAAVPGAST